MTDSTRVEWREHRDDELHFVIAEKESGVWSFFTRSSWELCWYPLLATDARIQRAESMLVQVAARVAA